MYNFIIFQNQYGIFQKICQRKSAEFFPNRKIFSIFVDLRITGMTYAEIWTKTIIKHYNHETYHFELRTA